jgi:hypothetical protein
VRSLSLAPREPAPIVPLSETSGVQFHEDRAHSNDMSQTLLHGTTQGSILNASPGNFTTTSNDRPRCAICGEDFGRIQELERHIRDVHTPKHQCPFCTVEWSRPYKIMAHLMEKHRDSFSAETWKEISALQGQKLINFLTLFTFYRGGLAPSASLVPSDSSPS